MNIITLESLANGRWQPGSGPATDLFHAVTGAKIAELRAAHLDVGAMLRFARETGGPALRKLTFHQRAMLLKKLAGYLMERKEELYTLSALTGATKGDSWIDIEGGIGTLYVYASKGRREIPNDFVMGEGETERISKLGTFVGRHLLVPLEGVAVHINAFNFPCWGLLEKFAPTFIAGMPAIVKPASITAYLAEKLVRLIDESGLLPAGSLQLICGGVGDLFSHLTCQDFVTFTGSAKTGRMLKQQQVIIDNSIRFNLEADSLNCCILGKDAVPGTPEFELFVKEVRREMIVKAGQKCTAIRRTIVPESLLGDVVTALKTSLGEVTIGDPAKKGVMMGPLVGREQVKEVNERAAEIGSKGERVLGGTESLTIVGADPAKGAFFPITLFVSSNPFQHAEAHDVEAFGPVNTVMPYRNDEEAIELARRGRGSLVGSLFSANDETCRAIVRGLAPYHGRIVVLNADSAKESTGHGSPLPHLIHGGPGRAGGGEEMGGIRGVTHYMQRAAIQGSPSTLSTIFNEWTIGGATIQGPVHPFRKHFDELRIGETLLTGTRTVTDADVVNFAAISGDYFYVHMDEDAAKSSIFERRVAHGYFVLSAAAGLFVDPAPGPVLANYGLEKLRFVKPVYIGDTIRVRLTCKQKTPKEGEDRGVVAWDVEVFNQSDETVAVYTILTLVKRLETSQAPDSMH